MTYEPVSLDSLLCHQGWAKRLARRLVREESDAEDLVQRTWIAAMRSPPAQERGARAWLRKVILNLAREGHRRDRVRSHHEAASVDFLRTAPEASEVVSQTEVCAQLSEHLLALKEPYRSVVIQRYYDGQSSAEIARRLGVPAGTVRWRLKVGLDQLREELDRRSRGDRSRWVSALLLFAPPGEVPEDVEPSDVGTSDVGTSTVAAAGRPGALAVSGWIGLIAASAAGVALLLSHSGDRGESARDAAFPSVAFAGGLDADAPPTTRSGERLALPSAPSTKPTESDTSNRLAVRVVDAAGTPMAGAPVFVAERHGFSERGTTDAEGRLALAVAPEDVEALGLPATRGRVALRALAEGRATSPLVHVAAPFTGEHEVLLTVGGPERVVRGRVLDGAREPVAGAVVAWFDFGTKFVALPEGDFPSPTWITARTDAAGEFALAHLPPSGGSLVALAPGFTFARRDAIPAPSDGRVEILLTRGATVRGRVSFADGRAAAGVRIACEPQYKASEWCTGLPGYDNGWRGFGEVCRTDANGSYALAGVLPGERTVWALDEASGLVASTVLRTEDGVAATWDPALEPRPGIHLKVVDADERPLAGWVVHLRQRIPGDSWWIRRRVADADGRVAVPDCPAAEALVDVFGPTGVGASFAGKRVRAGEEQVVRVETRGTSVVRGRLLDSFGAPLLEGKLAFVSLRTTLRTEAQRDEDGEFAQRLAPGRYLLWIEVGGAGARLAVVELRESEERELGVLAAPAMGTLRLDGVRLRDGGSSQPFFALYAEFDDETPPDFFKVSVENLDGERALPAFVGDYRIVSHAASSAPPRTYLVRVEPARETRVQLVP